MFGKKPSSNPGKLAERVRAVAETPSKPAVHMSPKRAPREPQWKPGTLTFTGGERLAVVVKNISEEGARVEYVRGTHLPERVLLTEPSQRINRWAYVTWQTWGIAGLKFAGPNQPRDQPRGA